MDAPGRARDSSAVGTWHSMRFDALGNVMDDRICVCVFFYYDASVCMRLGEWMMGK